MNIQADRKLEGGLRKQSVFKKNMKGTPLISIITVVFNGEKFIEETICSVVNQSYNNIEYIIIDGGSTDSTLDIIQKYDSGIDYWVSEKDNGIYNAMNKAIDTSRGDWLYFIGADDYLLNNESIAAIPFVDLGENLAISGSVIYENKKKVVSSFSNKTLLHNTLHHQSTFYNKTLFLSFRYDEKLEITADYELNLMLFLYHKHNVKFVDNVVCFCRLNGLSLKYAKQAHHEMNLVRGKFFGIFKNGLLTGILWCKVFLYGVIKRRE